MQDFTFELKMFRCWKSGFHSVMCGPVRFLRDLASSLQDYFCSFISQKGNG
jgi:hypothetical protein